MCRWIEIEREHVSCTVSSWEWAVRHKHPNEQTQRMLETTNSWHLQARTHRPTIICDDMMSEAEKQPKPFKWSGCSTRPYKFVTNKQPNYYQIRHPPKLWPLTVFHISSKSYLLNISAPFFCWPFSFAFFSSLVRLLNALQNLL